MKTSKKNNDLNLLFELSKKLDWHQDLDDILDPILETMTKHMNMQKGAITFINREKQEIILTKGFGFSPDQIQKGKYKLGEGITGLVAQKGEPLIIPKISEEPQFLNKTNSRKIKDDISFICVPIMYKNEVIGTLSADKLYDHVDSLETDINLLSIIAFMIGEAVSNYRLQQEQEHESVYQLKEENKRLVEQLKQKFHLSQIIGKSKAMQFVFDMIDKIRNSSTNVLLLGESGVGKELVANAIHYNSIRADKPFVKINCAALPTNLIESELFGYTEGAFTGATKSKKGKFEIANGGSIFLDEIGEMPLETQAKLLRVIQEKEINPIGDTNSIKVDVTIIAATNSNLEQMIAEKKFREDLYYRLNVFPILIPPLRKRKTDIMLLIDHFIEKYSIEYNKPIKRISTTAIDLLHLYHWPGNVRELQNCMQRAILLSEEGVIRSYHLPPTLQTPKETQTSVDKGLIKSLENLEKELIIEALKESRSNMSEAARILQVTDRLIGLRVKKYNIDLKSYF
jgi:Nif-specific regulatory protein